MSLSSRRSSRSTRPTNGTHESEARRPVWRSPSTATLKSLKPSVSMIFAEPEQVVPLVSAAEVAVKAVQETTRDRDVISGKGKGRRMVSEYAKDREVMDRLDVRIGSMRSRSRRSSAHSTSGDFDFRENVDQETPFVDHSPVEYTPVDGDRTPSITSGSEQPTPTASSVPLASSSTTATTMTAAAPFPASPTTERPNPSPIILSTLNDSQGQPLAAAASSTSWFASFSRSKGRQHTSGTSNATRTTATEAHAFQTHANGSAEQHGQSAAKVPPSPSSPPTIAITEAFPPPQEIASPVEEPVEEHATALHPLSTPVSSSPTPVPIIPQDPAKSEAQSAPQTLPPPPSSSTPRSPPKKRSWFYSSSNNSSSAIMPSPLAQVVTASVDNGPQITTAVLPIEHSQPQSTPGEATATISPSSDSTVTGAVAVSSTNGSSPTTTTTSRSTTQSSVSTTSLPSSIDDSVPPLPQTPPSNGAASHTAASSSITAATVTASRFTLSLPLLGRAKVPLGSVLSGSSGSDLDKNATNSSTPDNSDIGGGKVLESQTRKNNGAVYEGSTTTTSPSSEETGVSGSNSTASSSGGAASSTDVASTSTTNVDGGSPLPTAVRSDTSSDPGSSLTTLAIPQTGPASEQSRSAMATTASSSAATPSGRITVSSSSTWWDYVGWGTSNASAGGSGDGVSESAIEDSQSLIGMRDGDQEFDVATGAPTREQSSVISSSSAVSAVRHHSRPPPPPTTSSPTSSSAQAIAGSTPPASSQSRPSSSSAASTDFPSEPTMLQSQACSDSSARTTTAPEHCSHVTSSSSGTSKSKSNSDWKQAVASGSAESAQMSAGAESLEGARKIRHGIGSGTAPGGAEVVGVSKGGMLSRYEEGRLGGGDGCGEDGAKGCGKKDKGAQLNKGGDNDLLGGGGNTGVSKLGELADGGCVDGIGNGAARESLNVGFGVASAKRGGEGANWDGEGGGVLGGAGEAGAEGAGGDPGAVWYSPWSWYYGAPPTSMDVDDTKDDGRPSTGSERCEEQERRGEGVSGTSVPANDEGLVGSGDGRTSTVPPGAPDGNEESVTLEEEGGSGCDPLPPTTGSRSETEAEVNPIEASIQANRSVWASFFSSRALVVKAIGYGAEGGKDEVKRDENGIEVMDVDEDSESELDVQEEERGRTREVGKALVVAKQDSSKDRSVLQTDKKPESTPSTSDRPATPLTQDEGIKEKMKDTVPMTTKVETPTKSGTSTPSTPTKSKPAPQVSKDKSTSTNPSRTASPAPSKKSAGPPSPPNLVLPAWDDIFNTPPRNVLPIRPPPLDLSRGESLSRQESTGMFGKTMKFVSGVLFSKDQHHNQRDGGSVRRGSSSDLNAVGRDSSGVDIESLLERERRKRFERFGEELPKSWAVIEGAGRGSPSPTVQTANGISNSGGIGDTSANPAPSSLHPDEVQSVNEVLRGCKRVVVIGVHGWFPGAVMRTVFGEPTGTSSKFANMMEQALHEFEEEHGVQLEKITKIPLEGEGTIQRRVERLYSNLLAKNEWMDDLHAADAIIVATHSQGSVVSTHLLDRLITDKHIRTATENVVVSGGDTFPSSVGVSVSPERKPQRVCCLALCGIHLGPLRYLKSSSVVLPYIQYFENVAARELFEFQNTESEVSKAYVHSLRHVLYHGVKMVYIASLNDQVVPLYSGLFTAASHPMILRALYIDGDAYHSSDFLSNLLVLLLRLRNSGIPDGGLINHLSEATAGSLNGIGHSRAYEEVSTYSLAVRYLFEANEGMAPYPQLELEPFDAAHEQNDYEIPWTLRDAIADERVIHYFSKEIAQLRDAFREWQPKTTILRDLKRKLQPIQRLPSSFSSSYSTSKL